MADLVKLLRLRCLEERLAEERLVEARGVLARTLAVEEALIESRRLADAARLAGLGAGHVEDSIHQDQAAQQFEISARTLLARLTTQQEQVRTLAAGHRAGHQDRRRLEVVLEADARIRDHEEQRREQRQLDDAYLVARAASRRVSATVDQGSRDREFPPACDKVRDCRTGAGEENAPDVITSQVIASRSPFLWPSTC